MQCARDVAARWFAFFLCRSSLKTSEKLIVALIVDSWGLVKELFVSCCIANKRFR